MQIRPDWIQEETLGFQRPKIAVGDEFCRLSPVAGARKCCSKMNEIRGLWGGSAAAMSLSGERTGRFFSGPEAWDSAKERMT